MRKHLNPLPAALAVALVSAFAAVPTAARAQESKPADEQVVVPEVDRRDVKLPRYPSNDFELGAYVGTYATQNFGSSLVYGLRLGYAITEDVFVEAAYAQTQVSDDSFRQILPGGVFADHKEKLSYYNLAAGYNVLPGEVFIGANRALASAFYLIGGLGSTNFNNQQRQTILFGLGGRVFMKDSFALQVDMRDYIFSLDLLGKSQSTQNLELTAGMSFFF
jgi:outer membrane beta-barrel protein